MDAMREDVMQGSINVPREPSVEREIQNKGGTDGMKAIYTREWVGVK